MPLRLLLWQNKKKLWKGQGCSIFSWKIKLQLKKTTSLKGTFAKNFSKTLKSHVLALSISKIINDNRTFWKTILVHCTQKASKDEKINITKRERSSRTMKKFALLLTNVFKYCALFKYTGCWTISLKFPKYLSYPRYGLFLWQTRKY